VKGILGSSFLSSLYVGWRRWRLYHRCLSPPCSLVLLRYHSVAEPSEVSAYLDPDMSVSPDRFREHVAFLRERFDLIGMDEVPSLLGSTRRARRALAITFDDGYRDNHDCALPILADLGAVATFYVTTGPLSSRRGLWISELWRIVPRLPAGPLELASGVRLEVPRDRPDRLALRRTLTSWLAALSEEKREEGLDRLAEVSSLGRGEGLSDSFMTAEQVRTLRRSGMTIGAHTRSHPHLDRLSPEAHAAEVSGSRQDLEAILDEQVVHFAYPNPGGGGRFGDDARAAVADAGFQTAVTSKAAPLEEGTDPLRLPRLGVYGGPQWRSLARCLARGSR
jgi:peptidoglycan/xylan/chitin deacetylase (PgdA/CDA1 family)